MQQIGTPEQVLADIRIKEERARSLLEREELDALVIGRQDNFAWLTAGGDNHVVLSSELGAGYAVLTRDRKWLVTHRMDRQRFEDEFAAGQDFQVVSLYWYQGSPLDKVLELTRGLRVGADFALPGPGCSAPSWSTCTILSPNWNSSATAGSEAGSTKSCSGSPRSYSRA